MSKCMSGVFRDLAHNRRAASDAAKPFAVRRVNKNGATSKQDFVLCSTRAEAEATAERVRGLNPNTTFVVVER